MKNKKFWILIDIVALILLSISLFGIFGPQKEYLETKGTIVDFVAKLDSISDSTNYQTIINYSVDGNEYKNVEYGSYNSSMKIGDEVLVYYDPNDPSSIQSSGYKTVPYVILAASVIILIISSFFLFKH